MRRTLTVLVASAALLVPATAASAAQPADKVKSNASCNAANGGNYERTGHAVKEQARTAGKCGPAAGGDTTGGDTSGENSGGDGTGGVDGGDTGTWN